MPQEYRIHYTNSKQQKALHFVQLQIQDNSASVAFKKN